MTSRDPARFGGIDGGFGGRLLSVVIKIPADCNQQQQQQHGKGASNEEASRLPCDLMQRRYIMMPTNNRRRPPATAIFITSRATHHLTEEIRGSSDWIIRATDPVMWSRLVIRGSCDSLCEIRPAINMYLNVYGFIIPVSTLRGQSSSSLW